MGDLSKTIEDALKKELNKICPEEMQTGGQGVSLLESIQKVIDLEHAVRSKTEQAEGLLEKQEDKLVDIVIAQLESHAGSNSEAAAALLKAKKALEKCPASLHVPDQKFATSMGVVLQDGRALPKHFVGVFASAVLFISGVTFARRFAFRRTAYSLCSAGHGVESRPVTLPH